jgi:hypothetical protein
MFQIKNSYQVAVFWDVAPCNMVDIDRRFRGASCLHHQHLRTFMVARICKILMLCYKIQDQKSNMKFTDVSRLDRIGDNRLFTAYSHKKDLFVANSQWGETYKYAKVYLIELVMEAEFLYYKLIDIFFFYKLAAPWLERRKYELQECICIIHGTLIRADIHLKREKIILFFHSPHCR